MQDIKTKLFRFLENKVNVTESEFLDKPVRQIMDSVEMIKFLAFIERTFDIEIDDDEVTPESFETLGSITSFIQKKILAIDK